MKDREEKVILIRQCARERLKTDLIYEIIGSRGRSIKVYPYKCIISTDVTMGSVLTNNATDGEKTIYFKDVIGIQYKRSGITLGYLQFETATSSMNNEKSNFSNENTFTFDSNKEKIMEEVYEYVIGILDELKCDSITVAKDWEENKEILVKAETERLEKEKAARAEALSEKLKASQSDTRIVAFLEDIQDCNRYMTILGAWKKSGLDQEQVYTDIYKEITSRANIERMYGAGANSETAEKYAQKLLEMLSSSAT